jgi:hypothetical protein
MTGMGLFRKRWLLAGLLALPASAWAPTSSWAQGSNYDVKTMNFDMWCQEQAHLDPDRCDKRTPDDEKSFEDYRSKIEEYEIPYLQQKKDQITLDNNILHKDPVDNPITQDPQRQSPQQQRNPTIDSRTPQP